MMTSEQKHGSEAKTEKLCPEAADEDASFVIPSARHGSVALLSKADEVPRLGSGSQMDELN
jgi:hypothetical protein